MLTPQQNAILDFIKESFRRVGSSPTFKEIQVRFGFASPATVTSHLALLEKKGVIYRKGGHRAIHLAEPVEQRRISEVPLLGAISAGLPLDEQSQSDRFISIDADIIQLPKSARTFALQVRGDSMVGAGILDGDYVILEHGAQAGHGDIVAAAIDGEMTLKRLVIKDRKSYLKAENPRYKTLVPAWELVIEGVFRALVRMNKKVA